MLSESEPEGETLNKQTLQGERKKREFVIRRGRRKDALEINGPIDNTHKHRRHRVVGFFLPFKQRYLSTSDTFLFSPSHFLKPDNWTLVTCFTRLWLVRAGERDSGQGTAAQRHTGKRVVYPIRDTTGMAGSLCDTFIANKIKIKASGIVGINPNEFPKRNEQNPKAQEMGFN